MNSDDYLELVVFFLYVFMFNVPIVFILLSHHFALNQSLGKLLKEQVGPELYEYSESAINEATYIDKKVYMMSQDLAAK